MGGRSSKETAVEENIAECLQDGHHIMLFEKGGDLPVCANKVYTICSASNGVFFQPELRVGLNQENVLEVYKCATGTSTLKLRSPLLQGEGCWLSCRGGKFVFTDSDSEAGRWTIVGESFGDCWLRNIGENSSVRVRVLTMVPAWYDVSNYPLTEKDALLIGPFELDKLALRGLQYPRKKIDEWPMEEGVPRQSTQPLEPKQERVMEAASRVDVCLRRVELSSVPGTNLVRKEIRLEIEELYKEVLASSRLEVVEKAVLELDRFLQGLPHEYPDVVVPPSEVPWPGRVEYADFVTKFMIGISLGFYGVLWIFSLPGSQGPSCVGYPLHSHTTRLHQ